MPFVNIKITNEGVSADQKAELIKGVTDLLIHRFGEKSGDDRRRHRRGRYGQLGYRR
jgi:hypothetical protein